MTKAFPKRGIEKPGKKPILRPIEIEKGMLMNIIEEKEEKNIFIFDADEKPRLISKELVTGIRTTMKTAVA